MGQPFFAIPKEGVPENSSPKKKKKNKEKEKWKMENYFDPESVVSFSVKYWYLGFRFHIFFFYIDDRSSLERGKNNQFISILIY